MTYYVVARDMTGSGGSLAVLPVKTRSRNSARITGNAYFYGAWRIVAVLDHVPTADDLTGIATWVE